MDRISHILLLGVLLASGCARWEVDAQEKKAWKLPAPRMSLNTVVVELAFARFNPDQPEEITQVWQQVDEQVVPTQLRRRLNINGFRCGMIGSSLPPPVQRMLEQPTESLELLAQDPDQLTSDVTRQQHRLQSRAGVRTSIAASNIEEKLDVLISEDGVVRGETFRRAQCMLALRTFPLGDGRVRVELTPEIEHGEPRNRPVGQEGLWRYDFSRERKTFDALRLEVVLSPGQVFAISATAEPAGLGRSYFTKGPQQATMLLIRLAQTQKDELFEPRGTGL